MKSLRSHIREWRRDVIRYWSLRYSDWVNHRRYLRVIKIAREAGVPEKDVEKFYGGIEDFCKATGKLPRDLIPTARKFARAIVENS